MPAVSQYLFSLVSMGNKGDFLDGSSSGEIYYIYEFIFTYSCLFINFVCSHDMSTICHASDEHILNQVALKEITKT